MSWLNVLESLKERLRNFKDRDRAMISFRMNSQFFKLKRLSYLCIYEQKSQHMFLGVDYAGARLSKAIDTLQDHVRQIEGEKQPPRSSFPTNGNRFGDQTKQLLSISEKLNRPLGDIERLKKEIRGQKNDEELRLMLNIPGFDRNEQIQIVPEELDDMIDASANDRNDKKKDINRFRSMLYRKKNFIAFSQVRGQKLLRIYAKCVIGWIRFYKDLKARRKLKKEQSLASYKKGITVYNQLIRNWLIKALKSPIQSLIKNQDESINFLEDIPEGQLDSIARNSQSISRRKFLQIQIRVNTFLENIIETASNPKLFPQPLIQFFAQFYANKQFIPADEAGTLSQFEMTTLKISENECAIFDITDLKQQLLYGSQIFCRGLIDNLLLKPSENGFGYDLPETTITNLNCFAATIFIIFVSHFSQHYPLENQTTSPDQVRKSMFEGYTFVDQLKGIRNGKSSQQVIEEIYQYCWAVDKDKPEDKRWINQMVAKFRRILRYIQNYIKQRS